MAQALLLVICDAGDEVSGVNPTEVVGPQVSRAIRQGRDRGETPYSTPLRVRTSGLSSRSSTQGRRRGSTKEVWTR
jgi:hypothetical protein